MFAVSGRMVKGEKIAKRIADRQSTSSQFIIYFTKTSTTNMVKPVNPRLDIPAAFVREHGDKFCANIILERYGYGDETWPVALKIQHRERGGVRVFSRQSDWQNFVIANRINRGDILLFNLVSMSRFVVHVNPDVHEIHDSQTFPNFTMVQESSNACSCFQSAFNRDEVSRWKRADVLDYLLKPLEDLLCDHHDQFDEDESPRKSARFKPRRRSVEHPKQGKISQPQVKNFDARNSQIREQHFRPSPSSKLGPGFVKILCRTHVEGHARSPYGAKMEIPQEFVRDYRHQIHEMIKLEFQNSRVTLVNRGIIRDSGRKRARLTFGVGWRSFCDDNKLQIGDLLQFTLIRPSHFSVQSLGRGH